MKGKLIGALVVGLVVGAALPTLVRRQEARAQLPAPQEKEPRWEYKVVWCEIKANEAGPDAAVRVGKEFSEMATDGWEYVGPIQASAKDAKTAGDLILFDRPRK